MADVTLPLGRVCFNLAASWPEIGSSPALKGMKPLGSWAPVPNVHVIAIESGEPAWTASVDSRDADHGSGPRFLSCLRYTIEFPPQLLLRTLRALSSQGAPVRLRVRLTHWRCMDARCDRRVFTERVPTLVTPFARPPGWQGWPGCSRHRVRTSVAGWARGRPLSNV
jgi:hypothetical protein